MVIKKPEEVNTGIMNGKQSKESIYRVTGHAGHHLMDATAKYYKVNLTGKVNFPELLIGENKTEKYPKEE